MKHNGIAQIPCQLPSKCRPKTYFRINGQRRLFCHPARQRRSDFWSPEVNIHKQDASLDATQLLIRAGYLRQAYSGVYHMLPLGLRVQEKLEKLIEKHMKSVGASKVSLSSISSQSLWKRSGRLDIGGELFKFEDRKSAKWLLAPTHEEEITTLLADSIHDRRQLPVRLYQISRKYRDEKRPRGGLLRGREFIMKDLYTFDKSIEEADATYEDVRTAYRNFLTELGVPYIEARADSGNMGGKLSHEYHFPSETGEDTVITCKNCDLARNEEFVLPTDRLQRKVSLEGLKRLSAEVETSPLSCRDFISKDNMTLVRALAPAETQAPKPSQDLFNPYAIKEALEGIAELDTGVEEENVITSFEDSATTAVPRSVYYLVDKGISTQQAEYAIARDYEWLIKNKHDAYMIVSRPDAIQGISLLRHKSEDPCPECKEGKLKIDKAIEVGHTFHLGTRYSSKLSLNINPEGEAIGAGRTREAVQMGCHGIGVTRLLAAVTSCLSNKKGLIWPRVIAPFDVVLCTEERHLTAAHHLYDALAASEESLDVLLDDRHDPVSKALGYKIKDAHTVGYPIVAIFGKAVERQMVEIHCRRLEVQQDVKIEDAPAFIRGLIKRL